MKNITTTSNKDEVITAACEAIDSYQAQVQQLKEQQLILAISLAAVCALWLLF